MSLGIWSDCEEVCAVACRRRLDLDWRYFMGCGRIDRRGFMKGVVGGGIFAGATISVGGAF